MESLKAGYTTQVAQGSHGGGFADVELKKAIDSGLVQGPRILPAGPILAITAPGNGPYPLEWKPFEPEIVADGVEALRAGVRRAGPLRRRPREDRTPPDRFYFKPNGEMVNQALPSLEELKAVVDEAHRRGMFVATHTYGGDGLKWAIEAGVDDIQHATAATDEDIKMILAEKPADHSDDSGSPPGRAGRPEAVGALQPLSSRCEQTWKKMLNAGVSLGYGSGAAPVSNGQGQDL